MINNLNGTTVGLMTSPYNSSKNSRGDVKNNQTNNLMDINNTLSDTSNNIKLDNKDDKSNENNIMAQNMQNGQNNIQQTMDNLERRIKKEYIERNFYIDKDLDIPVVEIKNKDTDKVVVQYPSEMYLQLIMRLRESQMNSLGYNNVY